ncbi:unnamed protein product, partial [Adineta ricciae]
DGGTVGGDGVEVVSGNDMSGGSTSEDDEDGNIGVGEGGNIGVGEGGNIEDGDDDGWKTERF